MLTKLLDQWRVSVQYIQKVLKRSLKFSRILNLRLLEKWNRFESNESTSIVPSRRTRKRKKTVATPRTTRGITKIPTEAPEKEIISEYMKMLYIREFKKEKIKKYALDCKFYRQSIEVFTTLNVNQWTLGDEEARKPPPLIDLYKEFTHDTIADLSQRALQEKFLWESMIETEEKNLEISRAK